MGREVKRVPLDFDWPINKIWIGYENPYWDYRKSCQKCAGSGAAPMAKLFSDQWYGKAPFDPVAYGATPLTVDHPGVQAFATRNVDGSERDYYGAKIFGRDMAIQREARRLFGLWKNSWQNHLIQDDVDALIAAGRLHDFTAQFVPGEGWVDIDPPPVVTPDKVNAWSLHGFGHDAINQWVCVRSRCEREGYETTCHACHGDGSEWPTRAHKALYETWEKTEPPEGDGFQMWEDTTEGSPISPVFATAEELARYLANEGGNAGGYESATYEQWLRVCNGGFAPSMIGDENGLRSGVAL